MSIEFIGTQVHGADKHNLTVPKLPFLVQGTYNGNNGADRAIAHGLNRIPKLVIVIDDTLTTGRDMMAVIFAGTGDVQVFGGIPTCITHFYGVTACDATNFYIGDTAGAWGNVTGETYLFMAM